MACPYGGFFTPSPPWGRGSRSRMRDAARVRGCPGPSADHKSQLPSWRRAGSSFLDLGLAGAARFSPFRLGWTLLARRSLYLLAFCSVLNVLGVHKCGDLVLVNNGRGIGWLWSAAEMRHAFRALTQSTLWKAPQALWSAAACCRTPERIRLRLFQRSVFCHNFFCP